MRLPQQQAGDGGHERAGGSSGAALTATGAAPAAGGATIAGGQAPRVRDAPRWVRWTVLPLLVLVPLGYVIISAEQSRDGGAVKEAGGRRPAHDPRAAQRAPAAHLPGALPGRRLRRRLPGDQLLGHQQSSTRSSPPPPAASTPSWPRSAPAGTRCATATRRSVTAEVRATGWDLRTPAPGRASPCTSSATNPTTTSPSTSATRKRRPSMSCPPSTSSTASGAGDPRRAATR